MCFYTTYKVLYDIRMFKNSRGRKILSKTVCASTKAVLKT